jgi:alpha-tubulin suppressor-like RCC1 family protein
MLVDKRPGSRRGAARRVARWVEALLVVGLCAAGCAQGEGLSGNGERSPDGGAGQGQGGGASAVGGGATSAGGSGAANGGATSAGGSGAANGGATSAGGSVAGGSGGASSGGTVGSGGTTSDAGTGAGGAPATGGSAGAGGGAGCSSGMKDCGTGCVAETPDVGCGASTCTACPGSTHGKAICTAGTCDVACDAGYTLANGACVSVCADNVKNGLETDTDCGGPACPACADGKSCGANSDCASGVCTNGKCQAPSCTDGVQNGTELGVDCGGSCSAACGLGFGCNGNSGCTSGRCVSGVCVAPLPTSCGGELHACAISDGGRVLCWGDDTDGELGYGQTVDYRTGPIYVNGLTDATTIACSEGGTHTCAVRKTGQVVCWGRNADGELGDGTQTPRNAPTAVPGITNAVQVTAGDTFSCALLSTSEVLCWGQGGSGRLGNGGTSSSKSPVSVLAGDTGTGNLASAVFIASGEQHTCAVLDRAHGARVACWGNGGNGRLGNGGTKNATAPAYVHGLNGAGNCTAADPSGCLPNAGMVAGGQNVTVVVHQGGLASSSGDNAYGESGNGQVSSVPRRVTGVSGAGTLDDATFVAMGQDHGCAVHGGGQAVCWGAGGNGRLGYGQTADHSAPVPIVNDAGYAEVCTGQAFSCGRSTDGTVRCWGSNWQGQVGDGTTTDRTEPLDVSGVRGVVRARAGFDHACAVTDDTSLYCFGTNADYQLGLGDTAERWAPRRVSSVTGVVDVALQQFGTCALLAGGTVQCWGYDNVGENGDGQMGNPGSRAAPATVVGLTNAVQIAAGQFHACALVDPPPLGTGTTEVWCWGSNAAGQLGDGTFQSNATPVRVLGIGGTGTLDDAVAIGAGWNHTCAVRSTGEVACWGGNGLGQLGDNTTTNRGSPVAVKGVASTGTLGGIASGPRVIDGGAEFTCAVAAAGALYCWGDGSNGELGQGASGFSHVPVQVTLVSDFTSVAANSDPAGHVCGVRSSGELDCWGWNGDGMLGDATLTQRTQPVRVHLAEAATAYGNPDLTSKVVATLTGQFHSLAVHQNGTMSAFGFGANGRLGTGRPDQDPTPEAVCVYPVP